MDLLCGYGDSENEYENENENESKKEHESKKEYEHRYYENQEKIIKQNQQKQQEEDEEDEDYFKPKKTNNEKNTIGIAASLFSRLPPPKSGISSTAVPQKPKEEEPKIDFFGFSSSRSNKTQQKQQEDDEEEEEEEEELSHKNLKKINKIIPNTFLSAPPTFNPQTQDYPDSFSNVKQQFILPEQQEVYSEQQEQYEQQYGQSSSNQSSSNQSSLNQSSLTQSFLPRFEQEVGPMPQSFKRRKGNSIEIVDVVHQQVNPRSIMQTPESAKEVKVAAPLYVPNKGRIEISTKPTNTQKRKHQLSWLATKYNSDRQMLEERTAQGIMTKKQAWGKYGW